VLEVTDVCLTVGGAERFSHRFAAGEISVVLGANHAGKTDLCRLIAGLHTRARGEIRLDNSDLGGLKPQRRPVSLVYQAFVNYPNLTVAENIASPMRAKVMTTTARHSQVNKLAAMLQISDLLHRFPNELSGGQQQRLAIARALAKEARVLILDEPLANLDFKLREALEYELRDLLRSTNTIVIYTSSDPRDAFALGDQVLLLADGRKVQVGTPMEVYRHPISLVAMELLAEPCVNRFMQAGKTCALRPEHVSVGETIDAATLSGFDMIVTAYETNGDDSFIHGRVDEYDWVVRCHGMRDVHVGSSLKLHARPADVMTF
jgi:glycerol transport system ATP-binding protein